MHLIMSTCRYDWNVMEMALCLVQSEGSVFSSSRCLVSQCSLQFIEQTHLTVKLMSFQKTLWISHADVSVRSLNSSRCFRIYLFLWAVWCLVVLLNISFCFCSILCSADVAVVWTVLPSSVRPHLRRFLKLECLDGGNWEAGSCAPVSCPAPLAMFEGMYTCTNGLDFDTVCILHCPGPAEKAPSQFFPIMSQYISHTVWYLACFIHTKYW